MPKDLPELLPPEELESESLDDPESEELPESDDPEEKSSPPPTSAKRGNAKRASIQDKSKAVFMKSRAAFESPKKSN